MTPEPTTPTSPVCATSPAHYRQHPSGIECIDITRHMNFCLGNVIKYVWRAGLKNPDARTDLLKARQYLDWEIERYADPEPGEQT